MAYTPIYTPKNFSDWGPPDLDASNLNDIEAALVSLGNGLQTAAADTDTNTAAITTINGEISDLNNLIDEILPDDSESGNPAVITDAFGGECKSLKLTLEPIQSGSGTPSPQNVRLISGRTQSVVTRTGKNLWSVGDLTQASASGNSINLAAGNYVVKTDSTKILTIRFYYSDGTSLLVSNITSSNAVTFTTTMPIVSANYNVPTFVTGDVIKVQLELGSTATTYEPYNGETITRTYGTTIYGGTDDATGDGAVSSWEIVDLGDLNWTNLYTDRFYSNELTPRKANSNAVCSCFAKNLTEVSTIDGLTSDMTFAFQSTNDFRIIIRDSSYSSTDAFKTAMSGMKLAYEVATPTSIPLTSQNITLLHGDNVLTTDADNVDVEYKADIALYIAKQLGGNLGNRGAKSAPAEEPADDTKEEEKTDEKIIEPVTKEAKK